MCPACPKIRKARPAPEAADTPYLGAAELRGALARSPQNRAWLQAALTEAAQRAGLGPAGDLVRDAQALLDALPPQQAAAFPLLALARLPNRYPGTYQSQAPSLHEQLRQETALLRQAWATLTELAAVEPLLVILNECTPSDYFTAHLPPQAARHVEDQPGSAPILLLRGLKISSSHHRDPLQSTCEGPGLQRALRLAQRLGRRPLLADFSRRRFPRAFLRVARFAARQSWGLQPLGKLRDPGATALPEPRSPSGFAPQPGSPCLLLFDPWPISQPEVAAGLGATERARYCGRPASKPWQDDRIGARTELRIDAQGRQRRVAEPWVLPTSQGWMRCDHLFQRLLAGYLRQPAHPRGQP